jgi:hypothetical protein
MAAPLRHSRHAGYDKGLSLRRGPLSVRWEKVRRSPLCVSLLRRYYICVSFFQKLGLPGRLLSDHIPSRFAVIPEIQLNFWPGL